MAGPRGLLLTRNQGTSCAAGDELISSVEYRTGCGQQGAGGSIESIGSIGRIDSVGSTGSIGSIGSRGSRVQGTGCRVQGAGYLAAGEGSEARLGWAVPVPPDVTPEG